MTTPKPLRGQGKPLPPNFGYDDQWILEGRIFLYRPATQQILGGLDVTAIVDGSGSDWSLGINSMQLAWQLGVGSEEIFEHNRLGTLSLVGFEDVPPSVDASFAKRFTFQIGDRQGGLTVEGGGPNGNG